MFPVPIHYWPFLIQAINFFTTYELIDQFWGLLICKYYQNITSMLMFKLLFGIQFNLFIVLLIGLKIWRSNGLFLFYKSKCVHPKIWSYLRGFARLSLPDEHRAHNLPRPEVVLPKNTKKKQCFQILFFRRIMFFKTLLINISFTLSLW